MLTYTYFTLLRLKVAFCCTEWFVFAKLKADWPVWLKVHVKVVMYLYFMIQKGHVDQLISH